MEHRLGNGPLHHRQIGENQFQIGLSAGIGIFVIRHQDLFGLHFGVATLILPSLFAFQVCAIRRTAHPFEERLLIGHVAGFEAADFDSFLCALAVPSHTGACVPVIGDSVEIAPVVFEEATGPVGVGADAGLIEGKRC